MSSPFHRLWRHRDPVLLALIVAAITTPPAVRWAGGEAPAEPDASLVAWLEQRVPEVRLEAAPLRDALRQVNVSPSVALVVEWDALARVGVTADAPVSCSVREVKRDKVLRTILNEVGGGVARLDYAVEGTRIVISTERELMSRVTTRRYDLRPIVDSVENHHGREELKHAIRDLILDVVDSDTWKQNGGEFAEIHFDGGWLVVTQTDENHCEARGLLEQLHATYSFRCMSRLLLSGCQF